MLRLGAQKKWVPWKEAGIRLELSPLDSDKDNEFTADTVETIYRDDQAVDVKRDVDAYAKLVGRECIHAWEGVLDNKDNPVPCTPDNIDQFMMIGVAQSFVFAHVKGLRLRLHDEVDAAGKD